MRTQQNIRAEAMDAEYALTEIGHDIDSVYRYVKVCRCESCMERI